MLRRRDFTSLLFTALGAYTRAASAEEPRAGFRPEALDKLTADLKSGAFPNTHAVLVEQDGRLIYEKYFAGRDERWGNPVGERTFDADSLHDLRSVSKSVTSALVGIALGPDFEPSLGKPIGSFFPKLKLRPELETVTLRHVLTMTAGLEWNEMIVPYTNPKNDELQMAEVEDPVQMVLSRPLIHKPGEVWCYSGGLSQVLGGVIRQITGKAPDDYAKEVLFAPLGITKFEWLGEPKWNPRMPAAASGLRMRARDLARFGSLYLNGGLWQGKQLIPARWVAQSTRRQVQDIGAWHGREGWGYGYQWWIGRPSGYDVRGAIGNGNQRIFIVDKQRLVVTIFAGEYNKFEGHSERLFAAIMAARTA